MYAGVRDYTMGAGWLDALMRRVDEEFGVAISQEPGLAGCLALDVGDAMVETIGIFYDWACAERCNELAAESVRENLGEFELARSAVSGGEVLVSGVTGEAL
jgi:hypothetical protein